ncbi:hypothetical protein D3C72_594930 [compost metagenome]
MIDRAILEIMIMDTLALSPPKNTITVMISCPNFCGIRIEYISAFTDAPLNKILPPQATGKTNILMSNRYKGTSHNAVRRCFSLLFSTIVV